MALVELEITIASARELKNVNWKHGDLRAYAAAWVEDGGVEATRVRTEADASGDTAPSWGQIFTLFVARQRLQQARLVVVIYHDKAEDDEGSSPKKAKAVVGSGSLPLLEVADAGGFEETQEYTIKLKRPSGRPQGKVELAVRLKERKSACEERGWQQPSPYPGYTQQAYPAQPYYGQPYPPPPPAAYAYSAAPPPYYGSYPPPNPYPSSYLAADFYAQQSAPPPSQHKDSKFGGLGAGLAVGALAGGVGGLALGEYIDHKEDEAAEEQAHEDAAYYDDARDDDYGGGDDDY